MNLSLESFAYSSRFLREFGSTNRVAHTHAVRTQIDPILPSNIQAFGICQFAADRELIRADGSRRRPYAFGINEQLDQQSQLTAFLAQVIVALDREPLFNEPDNLDPRQVLRELQQASLLASENAELLLKEASILGNYSAVHNYFADRGIELAVSLPQNLRTDRESLQRAGYFFSDVYNEIDAVRDVIDRVTFTTVGRGYRVTTSSEAVRAFAEQRAAGMAVPQLLAQSLRDTLLFGTSCLVTDLDADISMRLIRPDRIDFGFEDSGSKVIDTVTDKRWDLDGSTIFRWCPQKQSPFGLSILEPLAGTLYSARMIYAGTTEINAAAAKLPMEQLNLVTETLNLWNQRVHETESHLASLFSFPTNFLPLDRSNLYFAGWEYWKP